MPLEFTKDIDRAEQYSDMFEKMVVPEPYQPVLIALAKRALQFKDMYKKIEDAININWYIVAAIHYRESNFSLVKHLHNGDSLTRRTVHEPKGRPLRGEPPFTWQVSAIDALLYDNLENTDEFTLGEKLVMLEKYNGIGYYKYHGINSPYLWNYTQFYTKGYYSSDGHYDPQLRNKTAGCAPLIAALVEVNNGWV